MKKRMPIIRRREGQIDDQDEKGRIMASEATHRNNTNTIDKQQQMTQFCRESEGLCKLRGEEGWGWGVG